MTASDDLYQRIRAEYREMPGLSLTIEQAARLWQLDAVCCEAILRSLLAEGVLARTARGAYVALPAQAKRTKRAELRLDQSRIA